MKKRYPDAFVRKIAQGPYSEGGIPDVMVVWHGHYFGFEVKRPLVGVPSALQEATIRQIRAAGGTAEIVSWPEQVFLTMEDWYMDFTKELVYSGRYFQAGSNKED